VAGGKFLEAAQRGTAWLGNGTSGRAPMSASDRDRMRVMVAEAHMGLGKPDAAARVFGEIGAELASDPAVLDLQSRIARALVASDGPAAVGLFAGALRATAPEDPAFRQRLIDWMVHQIQVDPATRAATVQEGEKFAALFTSPDCPSELRDAFEQLRSSR
jgi:hypothetical protein